MGRILITGATGFIGKHFLKLFEDEQRRKKADLILISSEAILGYTCVNRNSEDFKQELSEALNGEAPEIIFHLGSYTPKSGAESNDLYGSNGNISFTQALIEAVKPPERFIFTSTLDVYNFSTHINEQSIPNPSTLYACSKVYCENMLAVWAKKHKVNFQILRVGHVYGEGEEAYKKLIPTAIDACLSGNPPELFTNGEELRSFIYIDDLCKMIYQSASLKPDIGPINLVGYEPLKVKDVVQTIINQTNPELQIAFKNTSAVGISTVFDNSKTIEFFGNSYTSFQDGISHEIAYFKNKINKATRKIYLDLDGTIIDAQKRLYRLYVDFTGSSISFETYWLHKREQRSNEWLLEHFENYTVSQIELFKSEWMNQIELEKYLAYDELFPYTLKTLETLKSFADLILITGRQSYSNLVGQLENLKISNYFSAILNTANKISKEEMLLKHSHNFKSDDIIAGDTGIEILAGKKLGIITVAVLSGFRNKAALEKYQPDYLFEGINQIPEMITKKVSPTSLSHERTS